MQFKQNENFVSNHNFQQVVYAFAEWQEMVTRQCLWANMVWLKVLSIWIFSIWGQGVRAQRESQRSWSEAWNKQDTRGVSWEKFSRFVYNIICVNTENDNNKEVFACHLSRMELRIKLSWNVRKMYTFADGQVMATRQYLKEMEP